MDSGLLEVISFLTGKKIHLTFYIQDESSEIYDKEEIKKILKAIEIIEDNLQENIKDTFKLIKENYADVEYLEEFRHFIFEHILKETHEFV